MENSLKKNRAFELDVLRGFALFMMILMHLAYDIQFEFDVDAFGFFYEEWFWAFIEPIFLVIFVGVSGVCSSFSRSNFKRGLKLAAVALAFTLGTYLVTTYMGIECLILFNVLHLLSFSILVYALVSLIEQKCHFDQKVVTVLLALFAGIVMAYGDSVGYMDYLVQKNIFVAFLGIHTLESPSMADFMPIIPWLGVFLGGCVIGRTCYKDKTTLFPNTNDTVRKILTPFEFLGKHSLIVYIIHQPIVYGILYLIFLLIGRV